MGFHPNPKTAARLHAIQDAALRLVIAQGYDGFTMEELADAVGVSRRTLFNYVPDKASAVLGPEHDPSDAITETFLDNGPTGRLMPDLVHLVDEILDAEDLVDPCAVERHHLLDQAIAKDARVAHMLLERFTALTAFLADAVCQREGWPADDLRARAFAVSFLALVKLSLDEFSHNPTEAAFKDVFHSVLEADTAVRLMH